MKIAFTELPYDVRNKIRVLLEHRKSFRNIAGIGSSAMAAGSLIMYSAVKSIPEPFAPTQKENLLMVGALALGSISVARLLKDHAIQFKGEHFQIYETLKNSEIPILTNFLEKNNYVYVDRKGNLIGSKTKMQIGRVRFGRKRILSPMHASNTEQGMKKWLGLFPKKVRKKRAGKI